MDGWEGTFVQNMIRARQRIGLSQTELARRVQQRGVSCHQQTIARIENGSRSVRLNEAQELTAILFAGEWQQAIAPIGSEALRQLLREDVDRSVDDRSEFNVVLARYVDVAINDREVIEYDLGRYAHAVVDEEVDLDGDLVVVAQREIDAWRQLELWAVGEGEDVVDPEAS